MGVAAVAATPFLLFKLSKSAFFVTLRKQSFYNPPAEMVLSKRKNLDKKARVFVAMSGGVDSSVAAWLLQKQGYDVIGVFMKCVGPSTGFGVDCAESDAEDARRVAEKLSIPFYVWDFEEEYKRRVMDYMIDGYRQGLTPNPDVMCNREIKFGLFLERALEMGADYVATGHYVRKLCFARTGVAPTPAVGARLHLGSAARLRRDQARRTSDSFSQNKVSFGLGIARDLNKDQSYFLWTLNQEQLKPCLFPIGDYLKSEVREIARQAGLPTADKKDSQGICFLGKVTLDEFLKQYIPARRGAVLTTTGQEIGEHQGAQFYTIGQRHISIANRQGQIANSQPLYVAEKDVAANMLVVAEGEDNPMLYKEEVELKDVNFISPEHSNILQNVRMSVSARVRYRQPLVPAILYKLKAKSYKLVFDQPVKFVAPGQSAVFYKKGQGTRDPAPKPRRRTSSLRGRQAWYGAGKREGEFELLGGGIIKTVML